MGKFGRIKVHKNLQVPAGSTFDISGYALAIHVSTGGAVYLLWREGNDVTVTPDTAEAFVEMRPVTDLQNGVPE